MNGPLRIPDKHQMLTVTEQKEQKPVQSAQQRAITEARLEEAKVKPSWRARP